MLYTIHYSVTHIVGKSLFFFRSLVYQNLTKAALLLLIQYDTYSVSDTDTDNVGT